MKTQYYLQHLRSPAAASPRGPVREHSVCFDLSARCDDQTSAGGPDCRAEEEAGVPAGEGGEGRHHRGHHHRYVRLHHVAMATAALVVRGEEVQSVWVQLKC